MRVAVLYDAHADAPDATPDVAGVLDAVAAVVHALDELGHEAWRMGVDAGGCWMEGIRARAADVVFNLCEGVGGDAAAEPGVAAHLERLGVPFTGADAAALALARRKDRVNLLLGGAVPVPAWTVAVHDAPASWPHYPAIVKPAGQDAGIGITRSAVAHAPQQFVDAIESARVHAPLLIQQFLDGIELVVGFVAGVPLPVAEVDYTAMPAGLPHVVGYAAKWESGSGEDVGTRTHCPAAIEEGLAEQAVETARTAWRALSNRGYVRVDLRADARDVLHVLDVNPNPDLDPGAGLARMAAAAGWTYPELIQRILFDAVDPALAR